MKNMDIWKCNWKYGYENWIFKMFNWTKDWLEGNKKSFEDGATIFEYSFNDKRMDGRKIGLFLIYDYFNWN